MIPNHHGFPPCAVGSGVISKEGALSRHSRSLLTPILEDSTRQLGEIDVGLFVIIFQVVFFLNFFIKIIPFILTTIYQKYSNLNRNHTALNRLELEHMGGSYLAYIDFKGQPSLDIFGRNI